MGQISMKIISLPVSLLSANQHVRMIEKTYAKILAESRRDFIERGAPTL